MALRKVFRKKVGFQDRKNKNTPKFPCMASIIVLLL